MANWKRGSLWIAAGLLVAGGPIVADVVAGGDDDDSTGAVLSLFVVGFSIAIVLGIFAILRGVLIFMEHVDRGAAVKIVLATLGGIVLAVILHNVIYAITGTEEGVFFLLALFVGPVVLVAGIVRAFRPYRRMRFG